MGQVFSIYCNLEKICIKMRIYVFHKFLMLGEKLSHLSLKHKISKRLPENIGEYRWADTDQGGAVTS